MSGGVSTERARAERALSRKRASGMRTFPHGSYADALARDVLSLVERLEAAEREMESWKATCEVLEDESGVSIIADERDAAEARAARYEEAGKKLRRAVEWAICEDLNGVICSQPFNPGNDAFGMGDDAKPPRQPCASCEAGWKLMRESSEEWDAALSRSVQQEEEEGE